MIYYKQVINMVKKLILIDGNNLMFRSYYATAYTGNMMKNSKGVPTNALFGFVNMMNKIISEENPSYMAVAFDIGKNFRKEEYDFYKEGRIDTPEELKIQMPIAREILDKMGIKHFELAPYSFGEMENWISLNEWKNQKIAYFDKDVSDIPDFIQDTTFQLILNKLKNKQEKAELQQLFGSRGIEYKGEQIIGYGRVKPEDTASNHRIFELMKKAGYYDLTIYDFIKHLSDKRGAHIDMGIAPLIKIVNGDKSQLFTPIVCFGLQLIYAAKMQIPELKDYWPEMLNAIEKNGDTA